MPGGLLENGISVNTLIAPVNGHGIDDADVCPEKNPHVGTAEADGKFATTDNG